MNMNFSLREFRAGSESAHNSRHRGKKERLRLAVNPVVEPLENRVLMTASVWNNPSSSTANWNVASNWTPSTAFPKTSSDSANLNVDVSVNQAISLGQNLSVNSLTLGDTALTGGVGQSETINAGNTLTFDNGSSSATLSMDSGAVGSATIAAPITLNSNLTITNNSTQTLTISGGITTVGHVVTVNGSGPVVISGAIGGSGTVTKNDTGTLTLSANNSYNGTTTLNGGTILANQAASIGT